MNNVLGFPFIFRGALDVRATTINDEMKLAATHALAALAQEDVPDSVRRAYGVETMEFGPEYIIPKPFDPRVLIWEAPAVAQGRHGDRRRAACRSTSTSTASSWSAASARRTKSCAMIIHKAQREPKRVVFPEGEEDKILRACQILIDEKIATPILLGNEDSIRRAHDELHLHLERRRRDRRSGASPAHATQYAEEFYRLRQRKGITRTEARAHAA